MASILFMLPKKSLFPHLFSQIKEANPIVQEIAHHTPVHRSTTFGRMTCGDIYLKLECLQRTGSFKVRGSYYTISKLKREIQTKGCVAASAGNHAQGVAFAASSAGIRATIVMPELSPTAKIQATLEYGAELVLHGKTYDEAVAKALEICEKKKSLFIHSFDNPLVIAGQGTIGFETLQDIPDIDIVVVPVGGGGLISGISVALRNLRPNVKIYGVQASGAPSMVRSLEEGKVVKIADVDTIADGIAIKEPSDITFRITNELVDDIVTVNDDEIAYALFMLLERCKQVSEPAGVVALAALISGKINVEKKKVAVIISGANIDMSLLTQIIGRSLYEEGRFVKISGILFDKPGKLNQVLTIIAKARANIVNIEHDRFNPQMSPGRAEVTITLEIPKTEYLNELLKMLKEGGYHFNKQ